MNLDELERGIGELQIFKTISEQNPDAAAKLKEQLKDLSPIDQKIVLLTTYIDALNSRGTDADTFTAKLIQGILDITLEQKESLGGTRPTTD